MRNGLVNILLASAFITGVVLGGMAFHDVAYPATPTQVMVMDGIIAPYACQRLSFTDNLPVGQPGMLPPFNHVNTAQCRWRPRLTNTSSEHEPFECACPFVPSAYP